MAKKIKVKDSSVVDQGIYNAERKDLTIIFKSGKGYIYTPVSEDFAQKFAKAKSKGQFFNKHIRNNEALTKLKLV